MRSDAKRGAAAERDCPKRNRADGGMPVPRARSRRGMARYPSENLGEYGPGPSHCGRYLYCLLAIFPGIAAALALYGFSPTQGLFDQSSGVLPGGGQDVLRDQITRITAQPAAQLGFILGLVTSLWTASRGIRALIDALNIVYSEDEQRSLVKLLRSA
jgi:membrane protein